MDKGKIIVLLEDELEEARARQHPNPKRDSGFMNGIKQAIKIVESYG